jgi:hypothetical protein
MKTMITVFVAGAMLTSAVSRAAVNDRTAEERFRTKYGRYTPAEEARRNANEETRANDLGCGREDCCHKNTVRAALKQPVAAARINSGAEERFKVKWGRYTSAEEARLAKTAPAERNVPAATSPLTAAHADQVAARFYEKLGRIPEAKTPAPTLIAAGPATCELACCNRDR